MTILDIDQDYFFQPIISGSIEEMTAEKVASYRQRQVAGLATITDKFRSAIAVDTPILLFRDHDSVGKLIRETNSTNVILYHLDAHSDIGSDPTADELDMNISNWVSATHQHYSQVYWVLPDSVVLSTQRITEEYIPFQTMGISEVPSPERIDLITWTLSPEWCPQDRDLFKIFTILSGVTITK